MMSVTIETHIRHRAIRKDRMICWEWGQQQHKAGFLQVLSWI